MRRLVAIAVAAILVGCASVPVSTAVRLSQLDADSIQAIQPEQIRVRLSVTSPVQIDVNRARLALAAADRNGQESKTAFSFELVNEASRDLGGGLFGRDRRENVYEVSLSKVSVAGFNEVKASLLASRAARVRLSVDAPLISIPPGVQNLEFSIEIKLQSGGPYMALVEKANVAVGQRR